MQAVGERKVCRKGNWWREESTRDSTPAQVTGFLQPLVQLYTWGNIKKNKRKQRIKKIIKNNQRKV